MHPLGHRAPRRPPAPGHPHPPPPSRDDFGSSYRHLCEEQTHSALPSGRPLGRPTCVLAPGLREQAVCVLAGWRPRSGVQGRRVRPRGLCKARYSPRGSMYRPQINRARQWHRECGHPGGDGRWAVGERGHPGRDGCWAVGERQRSCARRWRGASEATCSPQCLHKRTSFTGRRNPPSEHKG